MPADPVPSRARAERDVTCRLRCNLHIKRQPNCPHSVAAKLWTSMLVLRRAERMLWQLLLSSAIALALAGSSLPHASLSTQSAPPRTPCRPSLQRTTLSCSVLHHPPASHVTASACCRFGGRTFYQWHTGAAACTSAHATAASPHGLEPACHPQRSPAQLPAESRVAVQRCTVRGGALRRHAAEGCPIGRALPLRRCVRQQ